MGFRPWGVEPRRQVPEETGLLLSGRSIRSLSPLTELAPQASFVARAHQCIRLAREALFNAGGTNGSGGDRSTVEVAAACATQRS